MKFLFANRATLLLVVSFIFLVNDFVMTYNGMDAIFSTSGDDASSGDLTIRSHEEKQRQLRGGAVATTANEKDKSSLPFLVASLFTTLNSFWMLHRVKEEFQQQNLSLVEDYLWNNINNSSSSSITTVDNHTTIHATSPTAHHVSAPVAHQATAKTDATRDANDTDIEIIPTPTATTTTFAMDDALIRSTTPIPGEKTLGMYMRLYSGFRNEAMAFQGFVMHACENNFTQILLPSLYWKDLFGTKRPVEHDKLFDVEHWNSFYPVLPRLVEYNESLFPDWDGENNRFPDKYAELNATAPYAFGRYPRLISRYRTHLKWVVEGHANNTPAILAMQQALRPHPDMVQMQRNITHQNVKRNEDDAANATGSYMALHARIEPDMQHHGVCKNIKVLLLQEIFDSIERQFPHPPVDTLFIAVNRKLLEKEANNFAKFNNSEAVENLKVLNRAREHGLWNGTVTVREAGMPSTMGTRFEKYPGVSGAIMDYYLALESAIFVGTEVSSFSVELVTNRFYQNNFESYHYRPQGLVKPVNEGDKFPPKFGC